MSEDTSNPDRVQDNIEYERQLHRLRADAQADEIDTLRAHLSKLQAECRAWRDWTTEGGNDMGPYMFTYRYHESKMIPLDAARAAVDLAGSLWVGKEKTNDGH